MAAAKAEDQEELITGKR